MILASKLVLKFSEGWVEEDQKKRKRKYMANSNTPFSSLIGSSSPLFMSVYTMQKGLTKVGFCVGITHLRGGCNVFGRTDFTFVACFFPNFSRRFASNYRANIFNVNKPEQTTEISWWI